MKPLAIDLFCGLGGWADGFLSDGYDVIGFDIERHDYGTGGYPGQLVLQDVLTLHGRQFWQAAVIVASPPCQKYSYMAMPWTRAKKLAAEYKCGVRSTLELNQLFDACFRIAGEAGVPLIVENVRGAQPWVGPANWNYGSFYLWGDVPALMPHRIGGLKGVPHRTSGHWTNPAEYEAIKGAGAAWFNDYKTAANHSGVRLSASGSKSPARKAASAQIAKIPFPLARHIARVFKDQYLLSKGETHV